MHKYRCCTQYEYMNIQGFSFWASESVAYFPCTRHQSPAELTLLICGVGNRNSFHIIGPLLASRYVEHRTMLGELAPKYLQLQCSLGSSRPLWSWPSVSVCSRRLSDWCGIQGLGHPRTLGGRAKRGSTGFRLQV